MVVLAWNTKIPGEHLNHWITGENRKKDSGPLHYPVNTSKS